MRPVVVGFGPCGIFAALVLAQMGLRPIVLERGKPVRERTKDTWGLWRKNVLNPESNVQFGEGGAGTFSDGKLYSQIKDPRHLGRKVMNEFVKAGAPDGNPLRRPPAHRHLQAGEGGGEHARADHRAGRRDPLRAARDRPADRGRPALRGLTVLNQATGQSSEMRADHVVLALGHSSRDTFEMLHERGVFMEAKPFSIGFRIEHPQGVIDRARWGRHAGHPLLGAADYKLVHHAEQRPLGLQLLHVPGRHGGGRDLRAGTRGHQRHEPVLAQRAQRQRRHGGRASTRATTRAGRWRASRLQRAAGIERLRARRRHLRGARPAGGRFPRRAGRPRSWASVEPSYKPGVKLGDLHAALPGYAIEAMREALPAFGRKIKGFDMPDAVLTGVETRTSSPLKITRGEDYQSLNVRGLYPAGEGASYAGGILSAGVDGIRVAEAVALDIMNNGRAIATTVHPLQNPRPSTRRCPPPRRSAGSPRTSRNRPATRFPS